MCYNYVYMQVQCDQCNGWHHLRCANVTSEDLKESISYCVKCKCSDNSDFAVSNDP